MFDFHQEKRRYFEMQTVCAESFVLPYIEQFKPIQKNMQVLEIGCGEAGVLKAFINKGCMGVGVDINESRIDNAKNWLQEDMQKGKLQLIAKDIYTLNIEEDLPQKFDLIVLKDVIEHIFNRPKLMLWMKTVLKPDGYIFMGFPPWQMPFGGHQQMNSNKWLSRLPYYHLLPRPIYKYILEKGKGPVEELLEIKETQLSIEQFYRLTKETDYKIIDFTSFLINPIYKYKFDLNPRKQFVWMNKLPYIRNYFTTCVYCLIQPK